MDKMFDYRLIPEFGGSPSDEPVIEWIQRVEMICELCKRTDIELILPLRLRGGALAVYRQLSKGEKTNFQQIKQALIKAYAPDSFGAYDRFVARRLQPGETVNEYLAELQQLDQLVGERRMICAFVSGLPQDVRRLLRASSRMDGMTLGELVDRVRAIMADTEQPEEVVAATKPAPVPAEARRNEVVCYKCSGPNHLSRDCLQGRSDAAFEQSSRRLRTIRCFRCKKTGHIASECSGNGMGEK